MEATDSAGGTARRHRRRRVRPTSSTGKTAWHIDGDGAAGGCSAGARRTLPAGSVAEPAGVSEGGPPARRESDRVLALGADRERAATATSCRPRRCTWSRSRCSASIASTPRSTRRIRFTRIKTTVSEHALGDFNIEHESTNQQTFGNIKWPTAWHSHHGWDDNWQFYQPEHRPQRLRRQLPQRAAERLRRSGAGPGVRRAGDAAHHGDRRQDGRLASTCWAAAPRTATWWSSATMVAVFEAPGNEERSLAVIEQIAKLAPNKPIRWLVSSHPHFDHIGGLRTYLHIGATIVAHMKNIAFLNRDVLNYEPRTVNPDIVSRWPPTGAVRGLQLRGGAGELRDHGQPADPAHLLRAAAAARRRHADGASAGRTDRISRPTCSIRTSLRGRRSCPRCARSRPRSRG